MREYIGNNATETYYNGSRLWFKGRVILTSIMEDLLENPKFLQAETVRDAKEEGEAEEKDEDDHEHANDDDMEEDGGEEARRD